MKQEHSIRAVVPWIERILWITALLCVSYSVWFVVQARVYQDRSMHLAGPAPVEAATVARVAAAATEAPATSVLGRLEIPAIALSVPILAGDETKSLEHGLFHIQGTAMPGGLGTVGLAGHRDTFFRPLRGIRTSMGIRLTDRTGTYHYAIDSTEIVSPDKVEVLDIQQRPELTLVTCYPFHFIGAAPQRFIVHAHLLSASPDSKP